jgi:ATP-dependent DNA helicase RecG
MAGKRSVKHGVEEPVPETPYENQIVEWKETWRDEYMKWICGFANAQGGKLIIGKDDRGKVVGVSGIKKLLTDIPNKIRDILGIIVDVNIRHEEGKEYLEIAVEPYPSPINYRGEYHYRTGSTKQELKGLALDSFLLKKYGLHWDGVVHPRLKIGSLEDNVFALFVKKGLQSGRLDASAEHETKEQLLAKLKLFDGSYLKRAAALLFSDDPETFAFGAFVKIGFFRTDADLLYQDEIHGNIFSQVDRTLDLLTTKYMKAYISYEGVQRIDRFFAPPPALREVITNAIVHKDYASANPIQIKVYEDKIIIWNSADIPSDLPIERLLGSHPSIPQNPLLAAAFFRAGYIESWGRGIEKIQTECRLANANMPEIKYDFGGVMVTFAGEVPEDSDSEEKMSEKTAEIREKLAGNFIDTTQTGSKTTQTGSKTTQTGSKTTQTGSKTTQTLLKLLKENPTASRRELAIFLGNITEDGIKYQLNKLKNQGLIHRIGSDFGGHWEVVESKNDK